MDAAEIVMKSFLCLEGLMLAMLAVCFFVTRAHAKRPAPKKPVEIIAAIHALRTVENWDGFSVGASGERGALQWKAVIWSKFSSQPHRVCEGKTLADRAEVRRVETLYIKELILECRYLGLAPDITNIALLHGIGYPNVRAGNISAAKRDFAARVANIYEEIVK